MGTPHPDDAALELPYVGIAMRLGFEVNPAARCATIIGRRAGTRRVEVDELWTLERDVVHGLRPPLICDHNADPMLRAGRTCRKHLRDVAREQA